MVEDFHRSVLALPSPKARSNKTDVFRGGKTETVSRVNIGLLDAFCMNYLGFRCIRLSTAKAVFSLGGESSSSPVCSQRQPPAMSSRTSPPPPLSHSLVPECRLRGVAVEADSVLLRPRHRPPPQATRRHQNPAQCSIATLLLDRFNEKVSSSSQSHTHLLCDGSLVLRDPTFYRRWYHRPP